MQHHDLDAEARLAEASGLALAIGIVVADAFVIPVRQVRPGTLFGAGQVENIATACEQNEAELADIVLPKCHLVISLLKRWILGTLQGNVGKDHLQDYLNEFTFRFNRRDSKSRGLLFYRLAQMAVVTAPNPRSKIVPPQDVVAG